MKKLILLICIVFIACQTTQPTKKVSKKIDTTVWSEQMQKMSKDVKQLIPFVYNREAYNALGNRELISATLKDFSEHAHKITTKMAGDDPLIEFSLHNLEGDLKRAHQAFDMNQIEYSRAVVKSSMNHCFRCHTLTEIGSAAHWDIAGLNELNLSPVETSDLLIAIRKYDEALKHMENYISNDDFLRNRPFDYELILRRYLAVIIRAEDHAERALLEVNKVANHADLPRYIAEQVQGWKLSLEIWLRETKKPQKKISQIRRAQECIDRATRLQQYPQDHAGDVEYLRATAILHESLKQHLKPEEEAQALYLLGRSYEVLDELGSWNLHEAYFESCVHKAPHSSWAKLCYTRLEASVLQGYSGSSGTHIPAFEKDKLKTLKEML